MAAPKPNAARRAALLCQVNQPAPLSYGVAPVNRRQRRHAARLLQRQATKAKQHGGPK